MPRARTRAEQKDATRARLLKVARRVFLQKGYDGTSVALVCREARVTRGALYHHFPSKDALFAAVVGAVFEDVAARVTQATETTRGWAQVEAACAAYLDACTDPEVQTFLFIDGPRVLPRERFDTIDHAVNASLVDELIEGWMAAGILEPRPVNLLARTLGAAFAEAGLIIRESEAPDHVRAELGSLLLTWVSALKRSSRTEPRPLLSTERLLLQPWSKADESTLLELCTQPELERSLLDGKAANVAWIRDATRESTASLEQGGVGLWLGRNSVGEAVGFAGFLAAEGGMHRLVFATAAGSRQRGFAVEMTKAVLREASARKCSRIVTKLDAASATAMRLVERLGFVNIGPRTGAKSEILEYTLPFRETSG